VDALKTHKKGLMQQLFPREGETQPRLRFPEFQNAGEWVQKTVGDVSDVLMCKRIFAEETNPSEGIPFYKIGTLGGVPDAFISREKFEDYKSRYNYPRTGEVLITCSGTVGKCLPFDGKDAYFQDSNIVWLDNPTGEVSNQFLLMLLSNVNWGSLNSTTITRIYGPDLRGMAIKYPEDEAEQERIATCLSSLDALITAETQKHEALKTHKKGLMQQLFPSPEDTTNP
jgi:type I restriction enzyme S subunit